MKRGSCSVLMLLAIGLAACAPAAPRADVGGASEAVATNQGRVLRIVSRLEVDDFIEGGSTAKAEIALRTFTAGLSAADHREVPHPVLAESLPQLNTDAWKVFPDGRMETIYRLRPDLTWHDGTPLTAGDFVFALSSFRAQERWGLAAGGGDTRGQQSLIDEIAVLDTRTLAIGWKRPFSEAGAFRLQPLPQHLLERVLELNDQNAYNSHRYWREEYVGAGPYRLARWERGAFMEGAAFEGYALGRPKIDRIVLTFSSDPSVTVSRLLAGEVDIAVDRAIEVQQVELLKQEWVPRVQGRILLSPVDLRYGQVQARPAYANPQALLDVRGRRAVMHAIDRPALAEVMAADRTMAAETMVPRSVGYYEAVDRAIMKYPFDPRRTEQLMADFGFTRGDDGFLVSPREGRFSTEILGGSEGQDAQESTIVSDFLKRAGIDAPLDLMPEAARTDESKGSFPALAITNNSLTPPLLGLHKFTSATIGTPQNSWRGNNRTGWTTPEFERLVNVFQANLDPTQADGLMVQMLTLMSVELPALPLYFNFVVVAHVGDLQGPEPFAPFSTRHHSVYQWEWR